MSEKKSGRNNLRKMSPFARAVALVRRVPYIPEHQPYDEHQEFLGVEAAWPSEQRKMEVFHAVS